MFTKLTVCIVALMSLTCTALAQEKPVKPAAPKAPPVAAAKKKMDAKKSEKSEGKKAFTGTVALNKATVKELETLPGIGPATAERIVTYRTEQGKFKEVSELLNVKGIGEKKLAQLRDRLTLD